MTRAMALLFGAIGTFSALLAPAYGADNQADRGFSLPIAVTGPETSMPQQLHTVPRDPAGSGSAPIASLGRQEDTNIALKQDGIIAVSQ